MLASIKLALLLSECSIHRKSLAHAEQATIMLVSIATTDFHKAGAYLFELDTRCFLVPPKSLAVIISEALSYLPHIVGLW